MEKDLREDLLYCILMIKRFIATMLIRLQRAKFVNFELILGRQTVIILVQDASGLISRHIGRTGAEQ